MRAQPGQSLADGTMAFRALQAEDEQDAQEETSQLHNRKWIAQEQDANCS